MEKIVGVYSSSIINDGLWQISRKGGDITVLTPRLKSFTAVKISENLFVLKEMNILLLFEKETNKVYLKLIHQGAGEITLQKL